ncbi:ribosomal protein S18-alanine N-acetyltransferase [candidate division KSB1 bacterium]|nr:ribosomal protein S18-alanine N-acetyltransferase [candidate division KSB1 bacterium]
MEAAVASAVRKQFGRHMVALRRMSDDEIADVATLEQQLFDPPWSADSFRAELHNTVSTTVVLQSDGRIIGYAVVWLIGDEMEIIKIAVAPPFRNQGIASWTLELMLERARRHHVSHVFIHVRRSNASAIHLYEKYGFTTQGKRLDYYAAPREDALLMVAKI